MAEQNSKVVLYVIIGLVAAYFIFVAGGDNTIGTQEGTCNPVWNADSDFDGVTFCTQEEALAKAGELGCEGFHTHPQDGGTVYMACASHTDLNSLVKAKVSTGGY